MVSPWKLTWDDENYYLIVYDEKSDCIKRYRVDKMKNLSVLGQKRIGKETFRDFNLAVFAKRTFGMYGGRGVKVTMLCGNELAGVIIDRFGKDVIMVPKGTDYFQVSTTVSISRQFFGWVTGVGKN